MRPKATIAALRAQICALEKGHGPRADEAVGGLSAKPEGLPSILPLGVPAIDAHLPGGGLRLAGLHEIAGVRDEWDDSVAAGFCLALLGRLTGAGAIPRGPIPRGPILWAARRADLYGPGVAGLMGPHQDQPAEPANAERTGGFYPGRLILVRARRDADVLWALEEGLRAPTGLLSAVVGEVGEPDDTAMRRLQLAAETAGRPCFVLRRRLFAGHAAMPASMPTSTPVAALTRWRVGALPPEETGLAEGLNSLPGRPRWQLELLRCRGAAPGSFTVEWDDAASGFALAAPVCDRPAAPRTAAAAAGRRAG